MLMSNYRCVGISLVRKSRGCLLSRFSSFPVGVFFPVVWFGKAVGVFFPVCGLVRKSRGCLLSRWVSSFPWFGSEKPWVSSFPGVFFPGFSRRRAANTGLESAHSAMGGSTEITFFWKFLRYQSGESSLISLSHLFLTRFRQVKVARRQSPRLPGTAM